ncbi:MAG TPA: ABC transporter permease [Chloroflexota bacterium]|nr:ABC transporter permease [Chloroflexota bacterium]
MAHKMVTPADAQIIQDDIGLPTISRGQRFVHHTITQNLLLRPVHLLGVVIVVAVTLLAFFGPVIAPHNPVIPDYTAMLAGPSANHLFGTDPIGYDIFSRILAGARLSLGTAVSVLAIALVIGLPLGALSGMAGGWIDEVVMRVTDMFLAFPALILALAIAAALGPGLVSAAIALSMAFWPWYARLLRGQVLSLKNMDYVQAATIIGTRPVGLMWRHILPNALSPIIVELSMDVGYAVLATASLSFIGLGAQPPSPEWGAMIVAGRDYLRTAWWTEAFPGIALTLTVLGFNLTGDGLRDALDPRAAHIR